MRYFLAIIISTALNLATVWGMCDKNYVEAPFHIPGKSSCYRELAPFSVILESVSEEKIAQFQVNLFELEYKNIPQASIVQYLNVDSDVEGKSTHLQMLSFLCSGETPVISDAYSINLINLLRKKSDSEDIGFFISSGQAAGNISITQTKKQKAKIYDKFIELYEMSGANPSNIDEAENIYIPNILLLPNLPILSKNERQIYLNYFYQTGSSINGCSNQFRKAMSDFEINNIIKTKAIRGMEIRRKNNSKQIEIIWET